jgi:ribosomal protein L7/L12
VVPPESNETPPTTLSPEQLQTIREALIRREKINAIKYYRELTGAGLYEAKIAVEEVEKTL